MPFGLLWLLLPLEGDWPVRHLGRELLLRVCRVPALEGVLRRGCVDQFAQLVQRLRRLMQKHEVIDDAYAGFGAQLVLGERSRSSR